MVGEAKIWVPKILWWTNWETWTDLTLASYLCLRLVVEDILAKETIDVNAQGGEYGTALQAASTRGRKEIVEMLLDKGADVNAQGGRYGI